MIPVILGPSVAGGDTGTCSAIVDDARSLTIDRLNGLLLRLA